LHHRSGDDGVELILERVRACRACAEVLPFGARPIFQLSKTATILIASQAPGSKAHFSGIPFSDPSGDRLRQWTGLSKDQFYDRRHIAILPMALCYPGRARGSGDAPPRPECALLWRNQLLEQLPGIRLTLLVGTYAQAHVLGLGSLTDRVRNFRSHLPDYFPLPHPSWRSRFWVERNPWFETDVLPALRTAIRYASDPRPLI